MTKQSARNDGKERMTEKSARNEKREARNCSKPAHSFVNATVMTSLHITTGYTATLSLSSPLNLHDTLFCGQAFRWQVLAPHPLYDYFAVVHHAILFCHSLFSIIPRTLFRHSELSFLSFRAYFFCHSERQRGIQRIDASPREA